MKGSLWQCKLKGKKTKLMSCGCCVAQNFKSEYFWKLALKEIRDNGK